MGKGADFFGGYYTTAEAARIAKVPRTTVDYWARTHLIEPSQRSRRPRLYSFSDLRDLVVAEKLRQQGAKIRDVRVALAYVRDEHDVSRLAQANFAVEDGTLIFLTDDGVPVAPHRRGQTFVINMRDVFETLGVTDASVGAMQPREGVIIDPRVRGGTPVVKGTRVPTKLILQLIEDGLSADEVVQMYPGLTLDDVDAALEWERSEVSATAS